MKSYKMKIKIMLGLGLNLANFPLILIIGFENLLKVLHKSKADCTNRKPHVLLFLENGLWKMVFWCIKVEMYFMPIFLSKVKLDNKYVSF